MTHRPILNVNDLTAAPPKWRWAQHWNDVLFLHWRVKRETLRPHLPEPVEIDTYDSGAWVSLVLFRLRVRPLGLPFVPGLSDLLEMNFRTYVRCRNKPGIWFMSVHADNAWAIRLAKLMTPMPYTRAIMRCERLDDRVEIEARQTHASNPLAALTFRPQGPAAEPPANSLDEWLLERYCLFAPDRHGGLVEAEVTHPRWQVQNVEVSIAANNVGAAIGLDLARVPDCAHFSKGVQARFGGFRRMMNA